jgi:ankyrin repeat protein
MERISLALTNGDVEVMEKLLIEYKNFNSGMDEMNRVLHHACRLGKLDMVELLVQYGASINYCDGHGWHSLAWAADYQHLHVVEYLISQGVDVNIADKQERTSLMWAVGIRSRNSDVKDAVVDRLIDAGADVNAYSSLQKMTVLGSALRVENYQSMLQLIAHGADINLHEEECSNILDHVKDETARQQLQEAYTNRHYLLK